MGDGRARARRPQRRRPHGRRRRRRVDRGRSRRRRRPAAASTTCAAIAAPNSSTRPVHRAGRSAPTIRCPYHSWTYGLDGTLRRAPFLSAGQTPSVSLHPVGVDTWGGFVFVHLDPHRGDAASRPARARSPIGSAAIPLADLRRGYSFTYEVAANWKVIAENYNECYHCGPVHPTLCDLVPAFRKGGSGLDWPDGVPHREGAWTFTTTGTSTRSPFPDLDEAERVRHKGELVYPNLLLSLSAEHVAALPVATARARPHDRGLRPALRTGRDRRRRFRPDRTPSTSGIPSTGRTGRSARACSAGCRHAAWSGGWFAPMEDDTADITRLVRRGDDTGRPDDRSLGRSARPWLTTPSEWSASVGSGRRLRTGSPAAAVDVVGFEQFELGHVRGASHDHSRIIRRSYHTPGYVELTAGAYDAWESVERDGDITIITRTGGIDLFPPDAAIAPDTYRGSLDAVGVPYEWIDGAEVRRRWPAFGRGTVVDDDVMAIHSPRPASSRPARARPMLQRLASNTARELRPAHTGPRSRAGRRRGRRRHRRRHRPVRVGGGLRRRLDEPAARTARPPHRHGHDARAGQLLPDRTTSTTSGPAGSRCGSGWTIRASTASRRSGRPRSPTDSRVRRTVAVAEVDPDTRTFDPDPTMEQRLAAFMRWSRRRPVRRARYDDLPVHPHGRPRLRASTGSPTTRTSCVGLGAAHGFKFAAWFGRELAALATGSRTRPELGPVRHRPTEPHRADRPGRPGWSDARPGGGSGHSPPTTSVTAETNRSIISASSDSVTHRGGPSSTASPTAPSTADVHG